MVTTEEDKIKRAFVRISGLRKNLPDTPYIEESLVHEYHDAVRHLEELGFDAAEFKIPQGHLERRVRMTSPLTGTVYDKERAVKRAFFVTKLDAIIGYFTSAKEKIGFSGSKAS